MKTVAEILREKANHAVVTVSPDSSVFDAIKTMADRSIDRLTLVALAGAIPAITLGTWVARRFPPPVPALVIRRAALTLLFLSGAGLVVTAGLALARG